MGWRSQAVRSALIVVLLTTTTAAAVTAKNKDHSPSGDHPIVGAWVVDMAADRADDPPGLMTFNADGTVRLVSCCDSSGSGEPLPPSQPAVGAWRPDPRYAEDADATIIFPTQGPDGFSGWGRVRGSFEVNKDTFIAALWRVEVPSGDDGSLQDLGPRTAVGARIKVLDTRSDAGVPIPPQLPVASPSAAP